MYRYGPRAGGSAPTCGQRAPDAPALNGWVADENLATIIPMIRHDSRFGRFLTSPVGKLILGAGIGGLVVAFANIQDPVVFVGGMVLGVVVVFGLSLVR